MDGDKQTQHDGHFHDSGMLLSGEKISFCVSGNILGVCTCLDSGLKFDYHVKTVCVKVSTTIRILYKLQSCASTKNVINLHYTFVYLYLIHNVIIWGGTFSSHMSQLIILQKKLIRIITRNNYLAHTSPLFYKCNILEINDIYNYFLCIHMFTLKLHGNRPPRNHNQNTKFRDLALPSNQRLTLTQHAISFVAPKMCNSLPSKIREHNFLSVFRKSLKAYLLTLCWYFMLFFTTHN